MKSPARCHRIASPGRTPTYDDRTLAVLREHLDTRLRARIAEFLADRTPTELRHLFTPALRAALRYPDR